MRIFFASSTSHNVFLQYLATWLLITPPFTLLLLASWPKPSDRPLRAPASSKPQWLFLEKIMLVGLMCSLAIVLGHKWSESRMIYLLQPCHLLLGVVCLLACPTVRSLCFSCADGGDAASAARVLGCRVHVQLVLAPLLLAAHRHVRR